jgi:hypothetical protein
MKSSNRLIPLLSVITLLFSVRGIPAAAKPAGNNETTPSIPALNLVLSQARKSVGDFWGQFKSVTCIEKIAQEKLSKEGKVEYTRKSTFDYLVLSGDQRDDTSIDESRLEQGKSGKAKNIPLLVTNGIPMLLLVFHPQYEYAFQYQLDGDDLAGGHRLVKIRFQHIPGTRSTTALRLRGKDYPLDLQGTASIDPETGAIYKIVAGLTEPMNDFNLKTLEMDVQYYPYEFAPERGVYWLPSIATVNIQTEHQRWRNTHRYSNYKRFSINTEEKVSR